MRDTATPHTPGPWRAVKFKDTKSWSLYASAGSLGNIRDESDARLTAAAPELLEAAKRILAGADSVVRTDAAGNKFRSVYADDLAALQAAIAKATGGAK